MVGTNDQRDIAAKVFFADEREYVRNRGKGSGLSTSSMLEEAARGSNQDVGVQLTVDKI